MVRILGIDTSNYTTSAAVVEDGRLVYDGRQILNTRLGERGLRQSEALFQHVKNLPCILNSPFAEKPDAVCVSTRPRPVEGSYMPVFLAGESMAESIGHTLGIPVYKTSHQEGHIEAACRSIDLKRDRFLALHLSGGTTEILKVKRDGNYDIAIIGGTKDISIGQFVDRIGVAMGFSFPAGKHIDSLAMKCSGTKLRIPSRTEGYYFNLSGQETLGLKFIDGYEKEEVAFAVMLCICKTLEKAFANIFKNFDLPVIIMGGVASSEFLRGYFKERFQGRIFFSDAKYASDNASGVAFIGQNNYMR